MNIKIVSEDQKPDADKIIYDLRLDVHVKSVSEITETIAVNIISAYDGLRYFKKPLDCQVFLTYPLSVIAEIKVKNVGSVGSLLWNIAKAYKQIYLEEEKSTKQKTVPIKNRIDLVNRNCTDGKYGVWGHDLEDLFFERMEVYENGFVNISIGS